MAGFLGTGDPRTLSKKVHKASRTLRACLEVLAQLHDAVTKAVSGEMTQTNGPHSHRRRANSGLLIW